MRFGFVKIVVFRVFVPLLLAVLLISWQLGWSLGDVYAFGRSMVFSVSQEEVAQAETTESVVRPDFYYPILDHAVGGNFYFRIPRGHTTDSYYMRNGSRIPFTLSANIYLRYPDMIGLQAEHERLYEAYLIDPENNPRRVPFSERIAVRLSSLPPPQETLYRAREARMYWDYPNLINYHSEEPFGLHRYTQENGRGILFSGLTEFFLHFDEDKQLDMWIECDDAVEYYHPVAICKADIDYNPYLMMNYRFAREYLPEWREMEQQIRDIVAEFIVPCEETPYACPVIVPPPEGEN